jgi:hypothetical protein
LFVVISGAEHSIWENLSPGTRLNYAKDPLPGTILSDPEGKPPTPDPDLFRLLTARITRIETLHLASLPHRRARFDEAGATWMQP